MKKNPGTISLIISTVCVLTLNFSILIEYIDTGTICATVSNICFLAADICILIGWIMYFGDRKKRQK